MSLSKFLYYRLSQIASSAFSGTVQGTVKAQLRHMQLKELASNDTFKTLIPNLNKICLSIPVSTASVERNFSQIKLIKTRLRSSLNVKNLMKIAVESPCS